MNSRRNFIKKTGLMGAGIAVAPSFSFGINNIFRDQKLKVGLIGVGLRGTSLFNILLDREDVEIKAVCDIDRTRVKIILDALEKKKHKKPKVFGKHELDYKNLLDLKEVESVIIATPWLWHTRMAKDAMLAGKYAGLEVSAANTLEECWDLINTHEKNRNPFDDFRKCLLSQRCFGNA